MTENKTALIIFVYSNLCTCKFSFFWDNCQRVQLLCCMVIKIKFSFFFFFKFYVIFKLNITVLDLPNIKMNPSGSSQCTSPKHPVSCIEVFFFFKQLPSCFPKWLGFLFCCNDLCLSLTHTTVLITVAL